MKNFMLSSLILIFLVLAFILYRVLTREIKEKALHHLSGNDAAMAYFKKLVRLLEQLGVTTSDTDTYYMSTMIEAYIRENTGALRYFYMKYVKGLF